jgi:hypothetical protein
MKRVAFALLLFAESVLGSRAQAQSYSNIGSAVTAAGTTRTAVIMPGYIGAATWTNPDNVNIMDSRPVGVQNHYPTTSVKAADYGVKCSGNVDDAPAINAAVSAALVIASRPAGSPLTYPKVAAAVELPQGLCIIRSPILLKGFGSLQGSANGTWLQAGEPWTGDPSMVEVVNDYTGTSNLPNGLGQAAQPNRFVKDINFQYGNKTRAMTGIKVWNQTGTRSTEPYPAGAGNLVGRYQIPQVRIEGDVFFAMDTAIDIEDCTDCVVDRDYINYVRDGVVDRGNNFFVLVSNSQITVGSYSYTPLNSPANNPTAALVSQAAARYLCSDTSLNCSTGKSSLSLVVSPQGFTVHDTDVSGFDIDAWVINVEGLDFHDNGFDYGGNGGAGAAGYANPTIYIGNIQWAQFHHNLVGNARSDSNAIEVAAATSNSSDSYNLDGIWITDNYIQSYQAGSTGAGIYFDRPTKASFVKRNFYIQNNQFLKLAYGLYINSPLQYSVIRGNYGSAYIGRSLIDFDYPGSTVFQGTVVADNTTPNAVKAVAETSGGGYQIGYNQGGPNGTPTQLTGTQVGAAAGCTITAGAVGNQCGPVTVTWPQPFGDSFYNITSCVVQSGKGNNTVSQAAVTNTSAMTVYEVALSITATGGGTIVCSASHP